MVSKKDRVIGIVDYAHTPDALKNVLETIKGIRTGNEQVITLAGCGGDRDSAKRPVMAQIACKYSNKVILTSDNPRSEDPEEILNQMQKGAVNGLNFPDATEINMQNCQICCEGKQSRFPFANKGTRATKLLEIIHADVCGPMETTSIGGSKYFLALEDDSSRMAFAYFLKTKDEVLYRFKEFKKYVENQTNCKIKFFRTDNGGEFCNKEFDVFLKKNGIVHQKTNPYTP